MRLFYLFAFALGVMPTAVQADPCLAIPDTGPMPAYLRLGRPFAGPVTYVGDGDSLCVAAGGMYPENPKGWVEVRLADYYAPELHTPGGPKAKAALARAVAGRQAVCTPVRGDHGSIRSHDRVIATCQVGGRDLGDLLRRNGDVEGGNGSRRSRR